VSATLGPMAKKKVEPPKRGPGRPKLDGAPMLVKGITEDLAALLDELDQAHELGGRAAALRAVLRAVHDDARARAAVERAIAKA
jgi:hypothetical protein